MPLFIRGGEPNFATVLIDGVKMNDPTTTRGKDPAMAKELELAGWDYPKHLEGRAYSIAAADIPGGKGDVALDEASLAVRTRREKRRFLTFPWAIYRGDPLWVPPLLPEREKKIDPARGRTDWFALMPVRRCPPRISSGRGCPLRSFSSGL